LGDGVEEQPEEIVVQVQRIVPRSLDAECFGR